VQGRRRARQSVPRTRGGGVHADRREVRDLGGGGGAGLARPAYAAQAALAAAANGTTISGQDPLVLIELMRAAGLVRRIATSINQAITKLNATGQATGELP
jgi:hypothetical protein